MIKSNITLLKTLILILTLFLISACNNPPTYPIEPEVTFISFAPDTIQQLYGNTVLTFSFQDGDGDLGNDMEESPNVFIRDLRLGRESEYQIPVIPTQGAGDGITGEVYIDLSQICCISRMTPLQMCSPINNSYQSVQFSIKIMDNKGNISDSIITPPLHIKCFD